MVDSSDFHAGFLNHPATTRENHQQPVFKGIYEGPERFIGKATIVNCTPPKTNMTLENPYFE